MDKTLLVNGQLHLYGDVGDPWGWGDGFTPTDVAMALADHGAKDITVRINSGGGIATDGMAIHSLLKAHAGKVTVAIDGIAASAASLIAMAGASIEMRQGAMMMIHDPASITIGNADTHSKAAARLDKLADNYAGVYATRAGKNVADTRALMKAETWLDSAEAIKHGFANSTIEEPAIDKASFDYRIYARAPRSLPVRTRVPVEPAATAAIKEGQMDPKVKTWAAAFYAAAELHDVPLKDINAIVAKAETKEAADTALAALVVEMKAKAKKDDKPDPAAGKSWAPEFFAAAETSGLTLKDLNAIVTASATIDLAKDALIDAMAKANNAGKPGPGATDVQMGADERAKFVTGVTKSIIAKAPMFNEGGKPSKDGERNEFSGFTLRELARMALDRNGIKLATHDPMVMISRAMQPVIMAGALSTSDFVNILANVANKSMLKGYEEAAETFAVWTGKGTLSDFKTATRVDLGLFPSLAQVDEGAEYTYASVSDRKVNLVLATYGKMFPITRQAIINDDLGAFTKIPARMGQASKRTIGNLVYAILTSNANAPDGVVLFHAATHKNLATGGGSAMSATSLNAGRTAMGIQTDPDNIKQGLNIKPKYLLAPITLQGTANQIMTSQAEPGQDNPAVANRVAGMAQVVPEARLDAASTTAWYLAGDPNQYDTIEVSYLNGVEAPVLEQKEGWNVDGVEFKVRIDAGVTLLDYRAFYKGAGA